MNYLKTKHEILKEDSRLLEDDKYSRKEDSSTPKGPSREHK